MSQHGYSGTPLVKKLGIKEGFRLRLVKPPENYLDILGDLPANLKFLKRKGGKVQFVHLFARNVAEFERHFASLIHEIEKDGMIWVSWYKKAAKIPTDLNENIIRNTALSLGLVDIKVCAVDDKWSALKVVWRKENR